MASSSGSEHDGSVPSWRLVGPSSELSKKPCRLMFSPLGRDADVCLFHVKGEFFAMDARCSHSGGPLCDGDIEDSDGVLQVFCPWHDYDFNLRTGKSGTGLQQEVYEVKLEDSCVYVKHATALSLTPFPAVNKT
ncbi:hypothetical protein NHX12_033546 [Muraenolepis orangiensis]|uniref:Rieske domain-containing protein n=1 Tax=Muraenolepis orangiensis TaxID=630683 RepID=A0A9Q0IIV9_9TELE|nr:hypothetical protein NHX12_033546 [Muraenolepis orangiensis]